MSTKLKDMKVIILAGGFGTRLKDVVSDVPKPMALIAGKPFLEHQINFLKKSGIKEIILAVHYKPNIIKSYFGDGARFGVNIVYSQEDFPLGTGGAIKNAEKYLEGPFFVLNGDSYSDIDLLSLLEFHELTEKNIGSIALMYVEKLNDYGSIILEDKKIIDFSEKKNVSNGLMNRGVYLFDPEIFNFIPSQEKISLEKEIFPKLSEMGFLNGKVQEGYFIDIGKPETYAKFKEDFMKRLMIKEDMDLRSAMKILDENEINVLLVVDENQKLLGILNDIIIRRFLINGGNLNQNISLAMVKDPNRVGRTYHSSEEIQKLSASTRHLPILDKNGIIRDIKFHKEATSLSNFPTVRGKSPLRISFGGGGTDMPYFFEKYGGTVINTTIDKYCHVTASKRADSKITINSDLNPREIILDSKKMNYNGEFDIIKSVYTILNPNFGIDFHLHNDLPPGRGLGSSASFATLITKIIGNLQGIDYDSEKLAETAYLAEIEELKINGGKQDQYAAVFGGFNWIEFEKQDKKIMHPLKMKEETINELKSHLILCYTGQEHASAHQHGGQKEYFKENEEEIAKRLGKIKEVAKEIKENFLSVTPNFERIGELLHESWINKKTMSEKISNTHIDNLYETGIKNGAYGGKLLGSGGGGYLLFFHPPKKRNSIVKALKSLGGEILDFNFEDSGLKTWFVRG